MTSNLLMKSIRLAALAAGTALVVSTSPSLSAQAYSAQTQVRRPFMMNVQPGLPATYTVSAGTSVAGATGTNLVIKHIYLLYAGGPIGSSLYVTMFSCYDPTSTGTSSVAGTWSCSPMNFQTPPINTSGPYVSGSFPVTAIVPSVVGYSPGQLGFNFCLYPSGACSPTPPPGVEVTVAGYFEPFYPFVI
jgi:hypothetical protein